VKEAVAFFLGDGAAAVPPKAKAKAKAEPKTKARSKPAAVIKPKAVPKARPLQGKPAAAKFAPAAAPSKKRPRPLSAAAAAPPRAPPQPKPAVRKRPRAAPAASAAASPVSYDLSSDSSDSSDDGGGGGGGEKLRARRESVRLGEATSLAGAEPEWRTTGNKMVGQTILKYFDGKPEYGRIVGWLAAADNDGVPLWHVRYDDGDSEDLGEEDYPGLAAAAKRNPPAAKRRRRVRV